MARRYTVVTSGRQRKSRRAERGICTSCLTGNAGYTAATRRVAPWAGQADPAMAISPTAAADARVGVVVARASRRESGGKSRRLRPALDVPAGQKKIVVPPPAGPA